jgi:hypothetical protein
MAEDMAAIIRDLKRDAIERCRRRIAEAAKNFGNKPGRQEQDHGIMSMIKRQHGL